MYLIIKGVCGGYIPLLKKGQYLIRQVATLADRILYLVFTIACKLFKDRPFRRGLFYRKAMKKGDR